MSAIRIIGIGSPFGDDRIGWDAIDAIERSGMLAGYPAGAVAAYRCAQPAADLLPLLAQAGGAILIDAMASGALPGSRRRIDAGALRADPEKISSHGLGVAESLALGDSLGLLPANLIIYGIEMRHAGAIATVDVEVAAAMPALLHQIAADLRELVRGAQAGRPPASRA